MPETIQPQVAGIFYPRKPEEITSMIQKFLEEVKGEEEAKIKNENLPKPKALIVPHAGYMYSGPVAAHAYHHIKNLKNIVTNVVLLGPSHKIPFLGIATTNADYFATPLNTIKVNKEMIEKSLKLNGIHILEEAFETEHCLEVQMPFLQMLLDDFTISPFLVGDTKPETVQNLLNVLWGNEDTLIIISSDLSHFHSYDSAKKMDTSTSTAIESASPKELDVESACGRLPIKGLLLAAKEKNLTVKLLDLRNSGDTAGDKSSVVGYGAYIVY